MTSDKNYISLVGVTTYIKGKITSQKDIRIDGKLEGDITTENRFFLGKEGTVIGNVTAKVIEIEGTVRGNVTCGRELTLRATSKILGDVSCFTLLLEAGAKFYGKCACGIEERKVQKPVNGTTTLKKVPVK